MSSIVNMFPDFVLDPEGEVTITLHNPNAPFAVWGVSRAFEEGNSATEEVATGAAEVHETYQDPGVSDYIAEPFAELAAIYEGHLFEEPPDILEPVATPFRQSVAERLTELPAELAAELPGPSADQRGELPGATAQSAAEAMPGLEPATVRFQVSARHMTLGSLVFKRMLKRGRKESQELSVNGTLEIEAYYFDAEAFLAFLRILHCQPTKLPRRMRFEQVAKLAVIADYYECRDLVGYYVNPVLDRLNNQPKHYSRNLILWIWVTYFFRRPEMFRRCTKVAMEEAGGPIPSLNLPIPSEIMEALNDRRIWGIYSIIKTLYSACHTLTVMPPHCTEECQALVLGSLMMQMSKNDLLSPKPEAPFVGITHKHLKQTVFNFKSPPAGALRHTVHYTLRAVGDPYSPIQHTFWMEATGPSFSEYYGHVNWNIKGLSLTDYTV